MEKLNADASKFNIWVRTELNAPAQRPWFTDTGGNTGAGELAARGRVARPGPQPDRPADLVEVRPGGQHAAEGEQAVDTSLTAATWASIPKRR